MAAWEQLAKQGNEAGRLRSRLFSEAEKARCPFLLSANGNPIGYGDEFRCVRDCHDDVDHELPNTAWMERPA